MYNGIVLLHKEAGMTSHAAVAKVRRLLGVDKAGHTGTLDPMATGVLPVLVGRAVKASAYMTDGDKHYIATLRLGLTTDTEDTTGTTLSTCDTLPTPEEVYRVAQTFVGEILQIPPMYSALKVGGKKLIDLARRGETIEREARPVTIFSMQIEHIEGADYRLEVVCSKGTYIRTLCADIGARLGCGGVMASLARASAAGFRLENCHTLSELEEMSEEARAKAVIPVEHLFASCPRVDVPAFYARLLHNGQAIYQSKLRTSHPVGTRVRLYENNAFFALGEVRENDDGVRIKATVLFVL